MPRTRIFVYGTLRTGQRNNRLLAKQDLLGPARTLPRYRLYRVNTFPGLVLDASNGVAVEGEIWELDDAMLARLDELEGVPHLFIRGPVELEDVEDPVQAYFYQGSLTDLEDCGTCWRR